jgi:hypothetical protein
MDPTLSRQCGGGKVVSPTHRPHITPQEHYYFDVSGIHFPVYKSEITAVEIRLADHATPFNRKSWH